MAAFVLAVALTAALAAGTTAGAVTAYPFPLERVQADGSVITVNMKGDEFFNWAEDENGNVIAFDRDAGDWRYAYIQDGEVKPGPESVAAGKTAEHTKARLTRKDLEPIIAEVEPFIDHSVEAALKAAAKSKVYGPTLGGGVLKAPVKTGQKTIAMLLEFNNAKLVRGADSEQYWSDKYFNKESGVKSLANYFNEMSQGRDIFVPLSTTSRITQEKSATISASVSPEGFDSTYGKNGIKVTVFPSMYDGVVRISFDADHPCTNFTDTDEDFADAQAALVIGLKALTQLYDYDFTTGELALTAVFAGGEASADYHPEGSGTIWAHMWEFDKSVLGGSG
jgi:hypothetical protein